MTIRIGIVPGVSTSSDTTASRALGQMLRVLDALRIKYNAPVETQTLEGTPPSDRRGFNGFLLGGNISAQPWLRGMNGMPLVAAPFLSPRNRHASLLLWAYEETMRMHISPRTAHESWVETVSISRAGLESVLRSARHWTQEQKDGIPVWAYTGWGETEDFAISLARAAEFFELQVIPVEELQSRLSDPGQSKGSVVMTLGRTALPLARILGAQGWVSWLDRDVAEGAVLAQASGPVGAMLGLTQFLDRLGMIQESRDLDAAIQAAVKESAVGDHLIEAVVQRIV